MVDGERRQTGCAGEGGGQCVKRKSSAFCLATCYAVEEVLLEVATEVMEVKVEIENALVTE